MVNVTERFLSYVMFDTQSNEIDTVSTTLGQIELAKVLVEELKKMNLEDISLDENGYVMATLPSNMDKAVPALGFIAHLDTSPDMSGKGVNPQIIEDYDGGDIILNKEKNIVIISEGFSRASKLSWKNPNHNGWNNLAWGR